jgi:hypothetical protein
MLLLKLLRRVGRNKIKSPKLYQTNTALKEGGRGEENLNILHLLLEYKFYSAELKKYLLFIIIITNKIRTDDIRLERREINNIFLIIIIFYNTLLGIIVNNPKRL